MGSAFGGGNSTQSVLGGSAASVITKLTTALAVVFMVTSLGLAYFTSRQSTDSMLKTPANAPLEEPAFRGDEQETPGDADTEKPNTPDASTPEPSAQSGDQVAPETQAPVKDAPTVQDVSNESIETLKSAPTNP